MRAMRHVSAIDQVAGGGQMAGGHQITGGGLPHRLALTDASRAPDPFALLTILPPGSGLVWRAYGETIRREKLSALMAAARAARVALWLAQQDRYRRQGVGVHIHLPEHALKMPLTNGVYKKSLRRAPRCRVTAAAHSKRAIVAAARAGVDAVLISPVFPTRSHPGSGALGVTRFAALAHFARSLGLEVYALGGITGPDKIRRLVRSGATGTAGIDLFAKKRQA